MTNQPNKETCVCEQREVKIEIEIEIGVFSLLVNHKWHVGSVAFQTCSFITFYYVFLSSTMR